MLKLKVPDAGCGHCSTSIENAVKGVDPGARIEIDLAAKTASIESAADPGRIREAVRAAGYDNEILAS